MSAEGCDLRQGVTEAGHAVLDTADLLRGPEDADPIGLCAAVKDQASLVRSGDLESRKTALIQCAAFAILAVEAIDRELGS